MSNVACFHGQHFLCLEGIQPYSYRAFLAGVVPEEGGCFPPTPCNSFVFEVTRLKFCTELLWGRTNILGKKNADQIDNDVTMTSSLL